MRGIDVTTRAIDVTTAGLLTQFFPCCTFAIRSFSQVSATPVDNLLTALVNSLQHKCLQENSEAHRAEFNHVV